ncbi:MAG: ROK family protein, partial [Eubacteriales bacterium]
IERKKLLGVGVSLPGILDGNYTELVRSHALKIRNLNLDLIRNSFSYPVEFENDANSALLSELRGDLKNAVYLSLSNTVGGALCIDGRLYMGDNSRAGEIGHMIIEKDGRKCYCGKKGCIDAYCAAHILSSETNDNLNLFFERLNAGDSRLKKIWNEYLEYLVIAITNLRMFYDCDIILGGYVGANLDKYLHVLLQKTKDYNLFDNQVSYIKTCKSKTEASALGIAISFLKKYLLNL